MSKIDEKALAATLDVSERRDWDDITAAIRYYETAKATEQADDFTERRISGGETIPLHGKPYYQPEGASRMKPCRRKGMKRKAAQPDGWTLVPNQITDKMQRAYFDIIDKLLFDVEWSQTNGRYSNQKLAYAVMLGAAPRPPKPEPLSLTEEELSKVIREAQRRCYEKRGLYFDDGDLLSREEAAAIENALLERYTIERRG